MRSAILTTAALLLALPIGTSWADEAWRLDLGERAIYEADVGDTAIFSYPYYGSTVRLYLPGLPGALDSRGTFYGYWIQQGTSGDCGAHLTGPDGTRSTSWGQAVVSFDRPRFPSGWTAHLGVCFGEAVDRLRADPLVGGK